MIRFVVGAAAATVLGVGAVDNNADPALQGVPRFSMTLTGTVTDGAEEPLRGVAVRLFAEGVEQTATRSDSVGFYRLEFSTDPESDETLVVCWIAPRTDLVSELALIRESRSDRALGLWSPCIPRLGARRYGERSVRLLDRASVRGKLAGSDCLR